MAEDEPYYARYDLRYRQVRELGLPAFKGMECVEKDIALLDAFLDRRDDADRGVRVIEFGCGDGYLAVHLAEREYDVVAFDYSAAAIQGCRQLAEERGVTVDFRLGDALDIAWADDESFDLGVSNNVLQMFGTTQDREKAVSQMRRVLRPGALLFLNLPSTTDVPEDMPTLEDHRKHREFMCDLDANVEIDGHRKHVKWPEVASWGLNIYSAAGYLRDRGFDLRYIHWEHGGCYGRGLTMYLERR